jgi:ribosome-associated protein
MTPSQAQEKTRILVQAAARVCEDKKGEDTRILELDPIDSGLSDFFLITSALNDRQAQAIADEIEFTLKRDYGVFATSVEGRRQGDWVLLDYVDFVVHVFLQERRAFYNIERLRKSARPLTPSEFDHELKAALALKTRAARSRAGEPSDGSASPGRKSAPARAAAKKAAVAKAQKNAAKSSSAARAPARKTAAKSASKKPAAGKARVNK